MKQKHSIENQVNNLDKVLKLIPVDKQGVASDLIEEIIFMAETLKTLKSEIRQNGVTDDFKQGKQQFTRENPALKSYNTTIQRYGAIYKQLIDLMPKTQATTNNSEDDDFEEDRKD